MLSNKFAAYDSMDIFITRNFETLEGLPLIRTIFIELLKRSAEEIDAYFEFNLKYSDYFRTAFETYTKKYFSLGWPSSL